MEKTPDEAATYVLLQIASWIRGTLFQGNRLLVKHRNQSASGRFDRTATVVEEEFFVVAARRLIRWIAEADSRQLISRDAFRQLRELERNIIDVRDMREHADDYILRNKGRRQTQFHYSLSNEAGSVTYSSDATATIVHDGHYLLGGRLSVQDVLEAAAEALSEFKTIIRNDKEFAWLVTVLES